MLSSLYIYVVRNVSTYMLRHSIANRDSLRASSNRIRGILDISACHNGTAGQEQSTADVEVGVRAFEYNVLVGGYESLTFTIMCRLDYAGPAVCLCGFASRANGTGDVQ